MNNCNVNVCLCDISLCSLSEAYKVMLSIKQSEDYYNELCEARYRDEEYNDDEEFISYELELEDALHIPDCISLSVEEKIKLNSYLCC